MKATANWCRLTVANIAGSRTALSLARCWCSTTTLRATSLQLRFVPSESTASSFEALQSCVQDHGCPVAFYSDEDTVFQAVNQKQVDAISLAVVSLSTPTYLR